MMKVLLAAAVVFLSRFATCETDIGHAPWLLNNPAYFHQGGRNGMHDVRNNETAMAHFAENSDRLLEKTDGWTDGEVVDAMEHFFWGMREGVAIELGALDGSPATRSMTCEYEKTLGWRRILVEGNPAYRDALIKNSPLAFSVNAAICSNPSTIHYAQKDYVGGIVEFMSQPFLGTFHGSIYNNCAPPGNLTSFNWSTVSDWVKPVECIPMAHVLHKAHTKHINYFILDVEGGELEVLKSINWAHIKFDVLCVETDPGNRPPGYPAQVTEYLSQRGYKNVTMQQGRNTWYTSANFVPSRRPGLDPQCFNGARRSHDSNNFKRCPM